MAIRRHVYLIGTLLAVFICGTCFADIPQEPGNQEDDATINLDNLWSNKTCKNIYCCIDGVLSSMNTNDTCLRVEGYGCHLRYQMQKFADTPCIMKGTEKDTLMCHRNILDCAYDLGSVLLDTQNKDCSDAEETIRPTLRCYRGRGGGSLICELKNNTHDLSTCPEVANCNYKKERVSCPNDWAPHRGSCYTYKESPLSWQNAEETCRKLGVDSHLTSIKRREENQFTSYDLQKASRPDPAKKVWWTGLRRIQPNQQHVEGHVFQWADNTTFVLDEDYDNWGIENPRTDVNHCVYVRDGQWYLADCESEYSYTCKMPATLDEDVPEEGNDPFDPYKSLYCRPAPSTTVAPVYTTENKKKEKDAYATSVMTTQRYTTQEITTKMMTTEKITTQMLTTELTSQQRTTPKSSTPNRPIEREASTKEVLEELNNVTRELNIPEETIEKINEEMDILTTNVGSTTEEASAVAVEAVDKVMDLLADSLSEESLAQRNTSEPIVIESEAMVVQVFALKKPECGESEPCSPEPIVGGIKDHTFSVDLPEALLESGATLAMSTVDGLQDSMPTNIVNEDESNSGAITTIGSLVTSIAISRWDKESVAFTEEEPLVLTFSVLETTEEPAERLCSYWDPNELGWLSDGCQYKPEKSSKNHTTCECTHLTSFAVLMQVMPAAVEQKSLPKALDYLTYIGCGLSIFCLLLLIFIFLIQKMHRSDRNIIHMNLALALLIAQIIFVIGIDQTEDQGLCKGIAACLHYFLLATFFWMFNEAIFLLSKTTSAKFRLLKLPFFLAIGWVSPVIVVGITLAAGFKSAYHTENFCWLQAPKGIWAFVGPAALIVLVNTGILIKVIHTFLSLKANMNKKKKERIRLSLRAMLLTLPLLGTTWLIGIFTMDNKGTLVFAYLFVILNSLQGVFIFVLYCVMNDEVKKGLEKRMSIFSTRSSMASTPGQSSKGSSREPGSSTKGNH